MLLSQLFLFALSAFALKPKSQRAHSLVAQNAICNTNVNETYFVVGAVGSVGTVVTKRAEQYVGFNFTDAQAACEEFGLRLANITTDQLPEIWYMSASCFGTQSGFWMDIYESLAPPFGCWSLWNGDQIRSDLDTCQNSQLFAICQVPNDVVVTYPTVTSVLLQTTSTSTSVSIQPSTTTTYITDYEFIQVTSTITEGTYAVTCYTSTKTIVHTVTNRIPCHHHHHHDRHSSSSSSSSSSFWNKSNKPQPQKVLKGPTAPEIFVACTSSSNDFFLVENQNIGNDATSQDACDALGYAVANVTLPILANLVGMFSECAIGIAGAAAGSWYSHTPSGCLVVDPEGVLFVESDAGSSYETFCIDRQWVLCRAGPPVLTTSTVQTESFTTLVPSATSTITITSLSLISTTVISVSTVVDTSVVTTVTFTNIIPSTLTTTDSTRTLTKTKTKCTTTTKCERC